ncbi:MAG: RIP metalloprotease RseP [Acidobacteria bacterium]|nr:RIP metalloprotease RseP [Acidobacteriota bacterium]
MTSILAFIFVIGVLVFVHELGHYLAARRIGVRVLVFSIGFGPKLLKVRRGDTEYCVCAIPLGGYVRMAGEHTDDRRTGKPDEFLSKSKWERFQVLIAGPAMNVVLAIVVMTFVLYQGVDVPLYESEPPVVGTIAEGSAADEVGIRVGDRIVSVAGQVVENWEELLLAVRPRADREIPVVVRNANGTRELRVTPDSQTQFELGDLGIGPVMRPQIRRVEPGQPADAAGIEVGDVIAAVEGDGVASDELIKRINAHADQPLTLTVRRGETSRDVTVTPALVGDVGLIGVQISPYEVRSIDPGLIDAFGYSLQRNYEWSGLIFQTLVGLFTAETSPRQLVGPVGIAQLSGGAAQVGFVALLSLMAMISLNLGILNLLPIPVLDGGHIAILALEGMSRRDFSARVKERMLLFGFVALMMLMVTVIYNDLTRVAWIERLMLWR